MRNFLQLKIRLRIKTLLFLITIMPQYQILAQQLIKGNVYNLSTREPVGGVTIDTEKPFLKTVSDANGYFEFKGNFKDEVVLKFSHDLFEPMKQSLKLIPDTVNDVMVFLKPKAIKLPEAVIYDSHLPITTFASHTTTALELERANPHDLGEYLRSIPGISAVKKGGGNLDPVIRGFKYSQINVLLNGAQAVEGGCPNRMDPASSRIDAEDIERLEIYKGPYALRFGASLGGTVNIITRQPKPSAKPEMHIKGMRSYESNWNGHKEHLSVNGSNKYASFIVSGNRWNYGNYDDGNGNLFKSAFSKYNYNIKLGGHYKEKYNFLFGITQSHHEMLFPALPMDETDDNASLTYTEYKYVPDTGFLKYIAIKGYISDVHHIMDNKNRPSSDTVAAISDVKAFTVGGKAETLLEVFKGRIIFGTDYQQRQKDGKRFKNMIMQPTMPVKKENLWQGAVIENAGTYFEYSKCSRYLHYILSARYDYNHASSDTIKLNNSTNQSLINNSNTSSVYNNISFSGGISHDFGEALSLSLSAGRATRSPDMLERFIILLPVGYDFYDYLGNPQLKPETNNEADLIVKYRHKKTGSAELNLFGSYVQDFIYGKIVPPSEQLPLTQFVKGVKRFENGADVYLYGFELAYASPDTLRLQVSLSAAFTYGIVAESTKHIISTNENYQVIINNDALNEIPPLETHIQISYKFLSNTLIPTLSCRYVAPQKHVSEAFYETATPDFALINADIRYNYNANLSFQAGVRNLMNKPYYEHLNRRVANTIARLYEPGRIVYATLIFNF